ncbi:ras and ef-hand domain-containing protein [Anaeramoeba flamelloides]|uniref:Ras and ef-hand domain-containing protein n=1 Tax=Anaeramoeba flamelloides TaxID=1746091 RepID=A0AAV8AAA6_9EUKA|nr:ras and ef-hand domain-containing protein [Anaeramoeba flamelloides]|eukprot:Anaeramoba_flamelloidesa821093_56.p1 GENE.a821093_56~~a821093_56.p1  ORF type:complete len:201 (-),score=31.06 a821093_56:157-759(-)
MSRPLTLKLLLIGDGEVGKSSILCRYCDRKFYERLAATVGIEYKLSSTTIQGKRTKLQIWDTAGQERFRAITGNYYRNTDGVIIVFDITKDESFERLTDWVNEIKINVPEHIPGIIVGNKLDLENERAISKTQARKLADSLDYSYIEVSALDGTNIDKAFQIIATSSFEMKTSMSQKKKTKQIVSIEEKKELERESGGCC